MPDTSRGNARLSTSGLQDGTRVACGTKHNNLGTPLMWWPQHVTRRLTESEINLLERIRRWPYHELLEESLKHNSTVGSGGAERAARLRERCQHHWVIEAARGPTSRGVCQNCGAEQDFTNSTDATWAQREKRNRGGTVGSQPANPATSNTEDKDGDVEAC